MRIGGDRICESALTAASSMAVQPLLKGNDGKTPARGRYDRAFRQDRGSRNYRRVRRSRKALPTTLTDDSAMAAAAMIGDSRMPKTG